MCLCEEEDVSERQKVSCFLSEYKSLMQDRGMEMYDESSLDGCSRFSAFEIDMFVDPSYPTSKLWIEYQIFHDFLSTYINRHPSVEPSINHLKAAIADVIEFRKDSL